MCFVCDCVLVLPLRPDIALEQPPLCCLSALRQLGARVGASPHFAQGKDKAKALVQPWTIYRDGGLVESRTGFGFRVSFTKKESGLQCLVCGVLRG
jgi:hypothetical protein